MLAKKPNNLQGWKCPLLRALGAPIPEHLLPINHVYSPHLSLCGKHTQKKRTKSVWVAVSTKEETLTKHDICFFSYCTTRLVLPIKICKAEASLSNPYSSSYYMYNY